MPDELNKTFYRISIRWKKHFRRWDEWSTEKEMDSDIKRMLIESAGAQNTYKSWYISESNIPINDWLGGCKQKGPIVIFHYGTIF